MVWRSITFEGKDFYTVYNNTLTAIRYLGEILGPTVRLVQWALGSS